MEYEEEKKKRNERLFGREAFILEGFRRALASEEGSLKLFAVFA
jgi:hypothetical protein